ncbi:MAG: hypothetical protein HON14_06390 [Rhodospirillaceae bacterium]|nr:hypothetical protein [Rhodospirillaceae bacterium]MBT7265318.1 hypothetical protein [Rhodospirillaceae bacterium]
MAAKYSVKDIKRTSKVLLVLGGFVLMAALTACSSSSGSWQHPTKPKDMWSADISACKSRASMLISRQLDIDSDSNFRVQDDIQVQFAAHDARKKRYAYFTNCLSGKGYRQVSGN